MRGTEQQAILHVIADDIRFKTDKEKYKKIVELVPELDRSLMEEIEQYIYGKGKVWGYLRAPFNFPELGMFVHAYHSIEIVTICGFFTFDSELAGVDCVLEDVRVTFFDCLICDCVLSSIHKKNSRFDICCECYVIWLQLLQLFRKCGIPKDVIKLLLLL